jgi:hypothetical protein
LEKFNPYHDKLGRFTFAPAGSGGSGLSEEALKVRRADIRSLVRATDARFRSNLSPEQTKVLNERLNRLEKEFEAAGGDLGTLRGTPGNKIGSNPALDDAFKLTHMGFLYSERASTPRIVHAIDALHKREQAVRRVLAEKREASPLSNVGFRNENRHLLDELADRRGQRQYLEQELIRRNV